VEGNFRSLDCRIGIGRRYPRRTTHFPAQILSWERVKRSLRARWLQCERNIRTADPFIVPDGRKRTLVGHVHCECRAQPEVCDDIFRPDVWYWVIGPEGEVEKCVRDADPLSTVQD